MSFHSVCARLSALLSVTWMGCDVQIETIFNFVLLWDKITKKMFFHTNSSPIHWDVRLLVNVKIQSEQSIA